MSSVQGNERDIMRMADEDDERARVGPSCAAVERRMPSHGALRTSYRIKVVSAARAGLRLGYLDCERGWSWGTGQV